MNINRNVYHERRTGIISFMVPFIAFIMAISTPGILVLDYIHVLLGALWTGVDVFLGLIFLIVLSGMENDIKSDIAFKLIPMTLFFVPTVSILTPLLGFILSLRENIFTLNYIFILIIIISIILVLLTFLIIVPASYKIYSGFKNNNANESSNGNSLMLIAKTATVQMVLQVAIISLMAYLVVYQ